MKNWAGKLLFALLLSLVAGGAMAAVDTTAAVQGFTDTGLAVTAIGGAMIAAVAAGIVFKWVTAYMI